MQICPVCFWEDIEDPRYPDKREISLHRAQINFATSGISQLLYSDVVRKPLPEEARPSQWMTIIQFKEEVARLVSEAFADVVLEDGISIHQARALDDYADEPQLRAARLLDPETRWQDIPLDKIGNFNETMVFFDPKGFRFHLPAFMIYALEGFDPETGAIEAEGVLSANYSSICIIPANQRLLNQAQRESLASFLMFVSLHAEADSKSDALRCFAVGMAAWLPPFLRNNLNF